MDVTAIFKGVKNNLLSSGSKQLQKWEPCTKLQFIYKTKQT